MPNTFYVDLESGSNNNSGDSFAVTLNGAALVATGTTTVTSVGGGFTGLAGRKIFIVGVGGRNINSVTNDTTIVLDASVSAGTYTFNIGGARLTRAGITTANCQGYAAGDTVRYKASSAPTSLSCTANWQDCSPTVILAASSSTLLADCESAFTASSNITATADATVFKVGSNSAKIVVASAFTTGLAAYFATGTLDLSASQILDFWFYQSAGTNVVAGDILVKLCSDVAGVTSVNSFSMPLLPIGGSAAGAQGVWVPMRIDFGSALGSSIKSIGIYIAADRGAATFYFDDFRVRASANLTKSIDTCDSAWTSDGGANVVASSISNGKEGTNMANIAIGSSFTTGLAAHFATGTLDISGFNGVSFMLNQSAGTLITGSDISLLLCSDTAGTVAVNTIALPSLSTSATLTWHRVYVDTGGALGNSIKSIALQVNNDNGAQTFRLDNIFATNGLSLQSLIGKPNSTGAGGTDAETWYAARSILNNTVILETGPASAANTTPRGYIGTPEFATAYKRETIKTPYVAASGTSVDSFAVAGTAGNLITHSGGWNRTDMSTRTDETWVDGGNGLGLGIDLAALTFLSIDHFGAVRYGTYGIGGTGASCTYAGPVHSNCNGTNGFQFSTTATGTGTIFACNNASTGIADQNSGIVNVSGGTWVCHNNVSLGVNISGYNDNVTTIQASNNGSIGVQISVNGATSQFGTISVTRNATTGISLGAACTIGSLTQTGNGTNGCIMSTAPSFGGVINGGTSANNGSQGFNVSSLRTPLYLNNFLVSDGTEVTNFTSYSGAPNGAAVYSTRHDNTDNNHWVFGDGWTANSQVSVRDTASGIAWVINVTSTNRASTYPARFSIGAYAVPSGTTSITVRLQRDNTGLTLGLTCRALQLPGIATDQTSYAAGAAGSFETVTISVSPTSAGVVELEILAYGGTTYNGYVDNLTVGGVAVPLDYSWKGQAWEGPVVTAGGSVGGYLIGC